MHKDSYDAMAFLLQKHVALKPGLRVLDIGSMDVNGTYRPLIPDDCIYTGLDMAPGPNVDLVTEDPYDFSCAGEPDVIISGNTMEHVEDLFRWSRAIQSICRQGVYVLLVTPTRISVHRHPVDCWRILPDGMQVILDKVMGLKVLECGIWRGKHDDCYGAGVCP